MAIKDVLDFEGLSHFTEKMKSFVTAITSKLETNKLDKTTVATSSTLGLVKSGTDITVDTSGNVSVKDNSHKHTVSNISDLTATASELNVLDGITASTAELNYTDGVTSNIQTQLNAKAPLASPTLTGNPTAPTPTSTSNNKQIATTEFVKNAVSDLVDSAPETLDTLGELAKALKDNADIVDVLNESIATKANASDLTSHTSNTTVHITSTERSNWNDANDKKHMHSNKSVLDKTTASYTTEEQEKLSGIKEGAEPITATISGSNPTATNSTNAPLIYGKFKGYTLQDGEPTPDNPVEINGLAKDGAIEVKTCGKNIVNPSLATETSNGVTFAKQTDNTYKISGALANSTEAAYVAVYVEDNCPIGEYILSGGINDSVYIRVIKAVDGNTNYYSTKGGDVKFSVEEKETKIVVMLIVAAGTTVASQVFKPMIRLAKIADDTYEPYTETTTAITTGAPLYEGDYLEVYADGSGKLYRTMGTVTISITGIGEFPTNKNKYCAINLPNRKQTSSATILCDKATRDVDDSLKSGTFHVNPSNIIVIGTPEDTLETLQAKYNGCKVVYSLETPTETPLTAEQIEQFKQLYTFEPVTNVLCDGEVTIRYYVNTDSGDTVGMLQDSITTKLNKDFGNVEGILPVTHGGTGKNNAADACNAFINALSVGTDAPSDADYYVAQYAGGGTTTTTYHRRPISALWNYIKSKLATVATSGSYNDLSNKPTIGNGTVTIKQAGTSKGTFTMNQSGNTTIELTDNNTTYGVATQSANGLESATDKKKLDGIATGAEVNQNAFSNVVVGSTTIAADTTTDTLTLVAGSNVTITPDATNDKITISSSHPTISKSTNTTSTASPSAGGTFTAIDSITQDSNGHVTKFNTKTVTLPSTSITVDSALSTTSTNPVQNKVVNSALSNKVDKTSVLSSVAECTASTNDENIAGASALAELDGVSLKVKNGISTTVDLSSGVKLKDLLSTFQLTQKGSYLNVLELVVQNNSSETYENAFLHIEDSGLFLNSTPFTTKFHDKAIISIPIDGYIQMINETICVNANGSYPKLKVVKARIIYS